MKIVNSKNGIRIEGDNVIVSKKKFSTLNDTSIPISQVEKVEVGVLDAFKRSYIFLTIKNHREFHSLSNLSYNFMSFLDFGVSLDGQEEYFIAIKIKDYIENFERIKAENDEKKRRSQGRFDQPRHHHDHRKSPSRDEDRRGSRNDNHKENDTSTLELIKKYKNLYDIGIITKEEYEKKRREILDL